jgi:protein-L-isoaspartate(D-aspartate) O-methyltransferase
MQLPPPGSMPALLALRRAYAESLAMEAPEADERLIRAFATVPREDFLGPGPWLVLGDGGFQETPDADPAHLYRNVLVAIDRARGINNGEPSLHMLSIAALAPREGERVAHVGAGTGYYTAIIAELVGLRGRVHAFEAEADLAAEARKNLTPWRQVLVHGVADRATLTASCDGIYASAGATAPRPEWLDAVAPGGRIVFPLVGARGRGAMLAMTRRNAEFDVRVFSPAAFIPMQGGIDEKERAQVDRALRSGAIWRAHRFHRGPVPADAEPLLAWDHGWLEA